jgi:hypothetical protein
MRVLHASACLSSVEGQGRGCPENGNGGGRSVPSAYLYGASSMQVRGRLALAGA